jgi:hypothetical protein
LLIMARPGAQERGACLICTDPSCRVVLPNGSDELYRFGTRGLALSFFGVVADALLKRLPPMMKPALKIGSLEGSLG